MAIGKHWTWTTILNSIQPAIEPHNILTFIDVPILLQALQAGMQKYLLHVNCFGGLSRRGASHGRELLLASVSCCGRAMAAVAAVNASGGCCPLGWLHPAQSTSAWRLTARARAPLQAPDPSRSQLQRSLFPMCASDSMSHGCC